MELLRRPAEIERVGNGYEIAQMSKFHAPILILTEYYSASSKTLQFLAADRQKSGFAV